MVAHHCGCLARAVRRHALGAVSHLRSLPAGCSPWRGRAHPDERLADRIRLARSRRCQRAQRRSRLPAGGQFGLRAYRPSTTLMAAPCASPQRRAVTVSSADSRVHHRTSSVEARLVLVLSKFLHRSMLRRLRNLIFLSRPPKQYYCSSCIAAKCLCSDRR